MNDTVKFMFIGLVRIAMYHYDMWVKVAYDNFDNKRRYDDDVHVKYNIVWPKSYETQTLWGRASPGHL